MSRGAPPIRRQRHRSDNPGTGHDRCIRPPKARAAVAEVALGHVGNIFVDSMQWCMDVVHHAGMHVNVNVNVRWLGQADPRAHIFNFDLVLI